VVISEISEVKNGQAIVKLNCDNHLLLSRITAKSIQQLGLVVGQSVFAQIKGIALLGAA
jgi:molybdate transport system ATP-binding protein